MSPDNRGLTVCCYHGFVVATAVCVFFFFALTGKYITCSFSFFKTIYVLTMVLLLLLCVCLFVFCYTDG